MKKRILTMLLAVCLVVALGTVTAMADGTTAEVGDESQLRDAIAKNNEVSITLMNDITLTGTPLTLTSGKNITINGMNHAINFDGVNVKTAFTGSAEGKIEGVPAGVTLTVNDVKFNSTGEGSNGYAVLVGSDAFNTVITLNNCEFIGLYSGVYSNGVFEAPGEGQSNPVISITNGIFTDTEYGTSVDNVTNGTVNDGTEVVLDNPTGDDVFNEEESFEGVVATVTNTSGVTWNYKTLTEALAAVDDSETLTLLEDLDLTVPVTITKAITLDLGGKTLTLQRDQNSNTAIGLDFTSSGNSVLRNGTIIDNRSNGNTICGFIAVRLNGNGTLTTEDLTVQTYKPDSEANYNYLLRIDGGTGTLRLNSGTVVEELEQSNPSTDVKFGTVGVVILGTETTSTTDFTNTTNLIIEDGVEITTSSFAISGNGSNSNGTTITINGGEITSLYAQGIYHPQYGTLNIDGGTVTGVTGIEIRSGKLNVSGDAVIVGTGSPIESDPNGNGSTTSGAGIAVVQHTTKLPIIVNITGGEISGYNALYQENTQKNDEAAVAKIELYVDGGNFVATGTDGQAVYSENKQNFISGGNFSDPIEQEYLAPTLTAELYSRSNPDAPYSYYPSVAAAQAAAQPGDVITDLTNVAPGAADVTITFDYSNGSVSTVDSKVGATVNLPTPTRNGYTFGGWRCGNNVYKAGETVTINSDTTFTAIWNAINVPDTYDIELIVGEGGEAKASYSNASAGTTITITVAPDEGYKLDYITVDGERISGTSFKMPAHDVTVRVYFTDGTSTLPFTDVSANQWFYDAVAYVYTNGMMEGDSATTFNPDGQMTRAMFWAVLGRIDGATITGANWVETARSWAMAEGVSDGTNPNDYVTREMMVTMLWRYAGEPASEESLSAYTDAASVSDWAAEAMSWALETGVIEGVTATTLQPQGTATRAQCATIFMRYDALVA